MYGGPLHNPSFLDKMLGLLPSLDRSTYKTLDRIEGMLETAYDEMHIFDAKELLAKSSKTNENTAEGSFRRLNEVAIDHHPFYVIPSALSRIIHCQAPSDAQLRGALRHLGYKALRSHAKPGTIKTDAPWSAIWNIMREWVRQKSPLKEGSLKEGMPGYRIMQIPKSTKVCCIDTDKFLAIFFLKSRGSLRHRLEIEHDVLIPVCRTTMPLPLPIHRTCRQWCSMRHWVPTSRPNVYCDIK
jgi:hypothetical protein